ncbi:MAG: hypothetical protein ACJ8F1_04140 [Polyangia bacterium]
MSNGIEARSADGHFKSTLTPGPLDEAVYDASLELLWIRRVGVLEVLDLRQEKPKAIPILADAPDEGDFQIVRGDHVVRPPGMCIVPGTTTITWTKRPSVKVKGFDEMDTPPHPRLEGAAWLAKQFDRPARDVPSARLGLPAAADQGGVPFGRTGWSLVVAAEDPGSDCAHYRCLLHDPRTKTFGKPPAPAQWKPEARRSMLGDCGLYRFEAGGKWFAINNQVCAVGGSCWTVAKSAQVLGWLDGEQDVGADN